MSADLPPNPKEVKAPSEQAKSKLNSDGVLELLDGDAPKLLHSVFDARGEVVAFGFTIEHLAKSTSTTSTPKTVRLVSLAGQTQLLTSDKMQYGNNHAVSHKGVKVVFRKPENGQLPDVDEHWSRKDLLDFLQDPQCLDGDELYTRLKALWRKHVDFDDEGLYPILVAWGLMTYVYTLFDAVPFIHFQGPKASGKSQAMDLLEQLTRQGYKARVTAAAVGDLITFQRRTILFDQADHMGEDHIDLFADSYRPGKGRAVVNMEKRGQVYEFETFGPKAFAGLDSLNEDLMDRSIHVSTSSSQKTLPAVRSSESESQALRAQSYRWALMEGYKVVQSGPFVNADWRGLVGLCGRERELWQPIEAMMEALNAPEEDRVAARRYYTRSVVTTKAEVPDDTRQLVELLLLKMDGKEDFEVNSSDLLAKLNTVIETTNQVINFYPDEGQEWSPIKLGRRLADLGLLKAKRREGRSARIYTIDCAALRTKAERFGLKVTD